MNERNRFFCVVLCIDGNNCNKVFVVDLDSVIKENIAIEICFHNWYNNFVKIRTCFGENVGMVWENYDAL